MAAVSTIIAATSAVAGFVSQTKAAKEAKKANRLQGAAAAKQARADEIAQARERRRVLRDSRVRAAASRQAGANQGVESSSAAIGGQGSIASQGFSNVNFLDRTGSLTQQSNQLLIGSSQAQGNSYGYQAQASMFNTASRFASGYSEGGLTGGLKTIFD